VWSQSRAEYFTVFLFTTAVSSTPIRCLPASPWRWGLLRASPESLNFSGTKMGKVFVPPMEKMKSASSALTGFESAVPLRP